VSLNPHSEVMNLVMINDDLLQKGCVLDRNILENSYVDRGSLLSHLVMP
jgi:hypothetical protein